MLLSNRLSRLAQHYHGVPAVWDIGCDHGQLGLSFLNKASVTQIHLVDPSALVIQTLKKKLLDSDIPRGEIIQIHHQRGQELTLQPDISKCLFIAGMGGKEIQEILQNLLPQLGAADRVVISPHRKILELRNYLHTSEFGLISEETLFEDEQFYQILCLSRDPSLPKVAPYGARIWQDEVGERYRQHQLKHFKLHQDPLSQAYVTYLEKLSLGK